MSRSTAFWIIAVALVLIVTAALAGHVLGMALTLNEADALINDIRREQRESQRLIDQLQRELDDRQREIDALRNHLSRREAVLTAARECGLSDTGAQALWQAGRMYGVPHRLIIAVAQVESRCSDIVATNRDESTDHGWMQLNSGTWPWLAQMTGRTDPHDEADNIHMGTWYLAWLNETYQDWGTTATAYNRGPGGLADYEAHYGTTETPYSNKVKAAVAAIGGLNP